MRVEITGWRARNLRGYLRDVDIDFSEDLRRITLLQMPNGTGKTTTMRLFRNALTGIAPSDYDIRSLKADDAVEDGSFEVALKIDDEQWLVEMHFDFSTSQCSFSTVSIGDHTGGKESGYRLPLQLRETLDKKITELFVFDGELASEIIETGASRADESIRALYKLDSLTNLKSQIDDLVTQRQRKAASISSASTKKSIERFQSELNEVLTKLSLLASDERKLEKKQVEIKKGIAKLDTEINTLISQNTRFADELREIEEGIISVTSDISYFTSKSIELFRKPPFFHDVVRNRLQSLGGTMQALKLPRTMSAEFFYLLSEQDQCICGSSIGEPERATILSSAEGFLGDDQIAVINQMKLSLRDTDQQGETLKEVLERLRVARDKLQLLMQRKHRIEDDPDAQASEQIGNLKSTKGLIERDLENVVEALAKLTSDHPGYSEVAWQNNIPACKREQQVRQRKLNTAAGTYEFIRKANSLKDLIIDIERRAVRRLRNRIKELTNDNLEHILPNERLRVANIDGSLRLTTDKIADKSSVSEGQKLAVSYAFLTALLARAPHQLPFVIDSPAVSLDVELRRTVGKLIPPLFRQLIIFVISSEREGFSDTFFDRDDVKYLTISVDSVTGRPRIEYGHEAFKGFHAIEENAR